MTPTDKMGAILAEACLDKDLRNEILTEHLSDMKAAKDEIAKLKLTVENLNKKLDEKNAVYNSLEKEFDVATEKLKDYQKREEEISKAEDRALTLKLTAEFAEVRRKDTMDMFLHVTKNPALTITKTGNIPVAVEGGNGSSGWVSNGELDTKEVTTTE